MKRGIFKTKAFILSSQDFRTSSRIILFFTLDFGKIKGILKAVRKEPLKYNSSCLIGSLNEIVFYSASSELNLISQIFLIKVFPVFESISNFYYACFFAEVINNFLNLEDENKKIFYLLNWALENLNVKDKEKLRFIFLLKLFEYVGIKPHLTDCLVCQNSISKKAFLSIEKGGLVCENCARKIFTARKIEQGVVNTLLYWHKQSLLKSLNIKLSPQMRSVLKEIIDSFLLYHLEKPLNTLNFL